MNKKIISYSVPYSENINSGPMVRVTAINDEIKKYKDSCIIFGNGITKLKKSLNAKFCDILYIESSTNRITLLDLISLVILKSKSKKTVVYIRDVYVELFPEEYNSLRKRVTSFFNKLTNKFYSLIANSFAFPTYEMGVVFFEKNNIKLREVIELPPACDFVYKKATQEVATKRLKEIKIMYLGGINYKYSGIENFINLIKDSPENYKFYIITYDYSIHDYLKNLDDKEIEKVQLLSLNKKQIELFIDEENITYMFHTRPLNEYDNLTYPIKFFDAFTWNLPILTAKNLPILKILGNKYPLYIEVNKPDNICKVIEANKDNYFEILTYIENIACKNRYANRISNLINQVL